MQRTIPVLICLICLALPLSGCAVTGIPPATDIHHVSPQQRAWMTDDYLATLKARRW